MARQARVRSVVLLVAAAGSVMFGHAALPPVPLAFAAQPAPSVPSTTSPVPSARKKFSLGQRVQVNDPTFDRWHDATVARVGKHHYYITRDDQRVDWYDEWVPESRLRTRAGPYKPAEKRDNRAAKPKPIPPEPPLPVEQASASGADAAGAPSAPAGDVSQARAVDPARATATYVPDVAPPVRAATGHYEPRLRAGDSVAEILRTPGSPVVGLVHTDGDTGPDATYAPRLERLDLTTSRPLTPTAPLVQLPAKTKLLALSPDGSRALAVDAGWAVHHPQIAYLFDVTKPEPVLLARFRPFTKGTADAWNTVTTAAFATSDVLLTHSQGGVITAWDLSSLGTAATSVPRAIWTHEGAGMFHTFALSGTGKYALLPAAGDSVVVETATGVTALVLGGVRTGGGAGMGGAAFSPEGDRLADFSADRLRVWDLPAKKLVLDLYSPPASGGGGRADAVPAFLPDGLLSVGNVLIDLKVGAPLWAYSDRPMLRAHLGRLYYLSIPAPAAGRAAAAAAKPRLRSLALPDPAALAARPKLAALSPDTLFALRPRSRVSLDVQTSNNTDAKVAARLRQSLEALGLTVAPAGENSPIRITARVSPGETKRIPYRSFGSSVREGPSEISFTERKWSLTIERDQQTLWQRSGTDAAPSFVSLQKDESIEAAIERQRTSAEGFFTDLALPAHIPAPAFRTGLGTTELP